MYLHSVWEHQIKQILMGEKVEIDTNTIMVEEFDIHSASTDRLLNQNINMKTLALNDLLNPVDYIYILNIFP